MIRHRSPISGIAASLDGRWIATAGYDNRVILSHALSKESVAAGSHDHLANQCQFSPDGKKLVSSGSDHLARVWSVPDMKLRAVLADHRDDVEMAAFDRHGDRIATASRDGMLRIFSASDGRLMKVLAGHESDVISVQWSDDNSHLVSSGDDGTVRRWSDQGKLEQTFSFDGVETDTLALGPGVVFAGNDDGEIIVLSETQKIQTLPVHRSGVKRLIFDPAFDLLISLSYDRSLKILKWSRLEKRLNLTKSAQFPSMVWARSGAVIQGKILALATFGTTYALYDLETDQWDFTKVQSTPGINAVLPTRQAVYSVGDAGIVFRDNDVLSRPSSLCNFLLQVDSALVTGGQDGAVINANTGETIYQHHSPLNCGASWKCEDSAVAAIGCYTGEALIFRMGASGTLTCVESIRLHQNAIKSLAYDSGILMSVSATGEAIFANAQTREILRREPKAHDRIANSCTALPGFGFASVSRDLYLRLWNLKGECLFKSKTPQPFSIKCVAASNDGSTVATGSYGGYVSLFDVESRTWTKTFRPTTSGISSIQFDPDGTKVFTSSYDGSVYIHELKDQHLCAA